MDGKEWGQWVCASIPTPMPGPEPDLRPTKWAMDWGTRPRECEWCGIVPFRGLGKCQ